MSDGESATDFDSRPEAIRRTIEARIIDGKMRPGDRLGLKADLQNPRRGVVGSKRRWTETSCPAASPTTSGVQPGDDRPVQPRTGARTTR